MGVKEEDIIIFSKSAGGFEVAMYAEKLALDRCFKNKSKFIILDKDAEVVNREYTLEYLYDCVHINLNADNFESKATLVGIDDSGNNLVVNEIQEGEYNNRLVTDVSTKMWLTNYRYKGKNAIKFIAYSVDVGKETYLIIPMKMIENGDTVLKTKVFKKGTDGTCKTVAEFGLTYDSGFRIYTGKEKCVLVSIDPNNIDRIKNDMRDFVEITEDGVSKRLIDRDTVEKLTDNMRKISESTVLNILGLRYA